MIKDSLTYTRFDSLRDIIEDNNQLLVVLNRFDISFGFGDGTVERVCANNGVDTETFLAVINFISGKRWEQYNVAPLSLIGYLRKSHARFIDYTLPYIKRTLIEGIHETEIPEIAIVILRFYDKYIEEVKSHMGYEDDFIFSYVENLIKGITDTTNRFQISDFSSSHNHMASKIDDLKELFIYKFKQKNNEIINTALIHLMLCGKELVQHCEIENHLLFPQVEKLEKELRKRNLDVVSDKKQDEEAVVDILTDREKETLRWIAKGLVTKEIADKMCLSQHTINSYRKSISTKLNIHSASGMAVYAILHHIIDTTEIDFA
ncbi:MAG: LuxR C-terminal-related transcriptional regulator [Prevotella sp.]|nr:LuxR C-terminal-related transcriptional regulator [Bacteroides sp.]MCM1366841.1 LuxR C-terminal-related transcriptional regulator [Prevotella sp.]MCM1437191.1 LuxR C-terminal-related transcriptional regulator [Prevotella sp.]